MAQTMRCNRPNKSSYLNIRTLLQIILVLVLLLGTNGKVSFAQTPEAEGAVYIVQDGDTLWSIAVRFGISVDALTQANDITNPDQVGTGSRLKIPGLQGIQGVLATQTIQYGETLRSLSRQHQTSIDSLVKLNHLTSPVELFPGSSLVIPQPEGERPASKRTILLPGQSMLELALANNANPWSLVVENQVTNSQHVVPGEVLKTPGGSESENADASPGALPLAIESIDLKPGFFYQGQVGVIRVQGQDGLAVKGTLADRELKFFSDGEGGFVSLQGIHAMQEPGLYTLAITYTLPAQEPYPQSDFEFSQSVLIRRGDYPFDPVLIVSPETIDPAVTKPEDAEWSALAAPATSVKLWQGVFQSPAPEPYSDCWPSTFGNRRSYNGSAYIYFHTGLDFCGGVGTEILAPAAGVVVFAGPLTVRGNATMIDHGWGVYTGYMHQSEILVEVGDSVEPGQVIGLVGGTGRVTGPHLHWEVWAGGVQIDPMDWLEEVFP